MNDTRPRHSREGGNPVQEAFGREEKQQNRLPLNCNKKPTALSLSNPNNMNF